MKTIIFFFVITLFTIEVFPQYFIIHRNVGIKVVTEAKTHNLDPHKLKDIFIGLAQYWREVKEWKARLREQDTILNEIGNKVEELK